MCLLDNITFFRLFFFSVLNCKLMSKAFESIRFCNIFIEDNQLKIRSLLFFKYVRNEALFILTN